MGHLTALGGTVDEALERASTALGGLRWADEPAPPTDEEEAT